MFFKKIIFNIVDTIQNHKNILILKKINSKNFKNSF